MDDDTLLFAQRLFEMLARADYRLPLLLGHPIPVFSRDYPDGRKVASSSLARMGETGWPVREWCWDRRDEGGSWMQPCLNEWTPSSRCNVRPGARGGLPASSSDSCDMWFDGTAMSECRECFCPVRRDASGQFMLDRQHGWASLVSASAAPYGGYGFVMSAGLLNQIPKASWKQCVRKLVCGPSDYRCMCMRRGDPSPTAHPCVPHLCATELGPACKTWPDTRLGSFLGLRPGQRLIILTRPSCDSLLWSRCPR